MVPPIDEASQDVSFLRYRTALIDAVVARDTEAVVALASPEISLSFGGNEGHDEFRDFLNVPVGKLSDEYKPRAPQMRAEYWSALETVLKMGGRFVEGGFYAPYTWLAPEPRNMCVNKVKMSRIVQSRNVSIYYRNCIIGKIFVHEDCSH